MAEVARPAVADVVDPRDVATLKRCTCTFIKKLCNGLKLQLGTQCTALVYFHRFMARQAFGNHDRFVLGTACVFLAGKVEEEFKRLEEVVRVAQAIHDFGPIKAASSSLASSVDANNGGAAASASAAKPSEDGAPASSTSSSAAGAVGSAAAPSVESEQGRALREKVLLSERVLLHSLSFDVSVTHPHMHVHHLLGPVRTQIGQKGLIEFRSVAWNFLNDSLFTDLCVRYSHKEIGAASVLLAYYYLSARLDSVNSFTQRAVGVVGREIMGKPDKIFDQDPLRLRSIIETILAVYSTTSTLAAGLPGSAPGSSENGSAPEPKRARVA